MLVLLTLIFAAIPLLILWSWLRWQKEDSKIGISGPATLPIIGNLLELWKPISISKEYLKFLEYAKTYGETFRVRLGPKMMICTTDVKLIEVIANDPKFVKSDEYKLYEVWWGDGLILSSGEKWFKFRKLLTPAFHYQILERFVPIFEEQSDILVDRLKQLSNKAPIDVVPILHSFSLDVIAKTAMGIKLKTQSNAYSKFVEYNAEMAKIVYKRVFNPFLMQEWIWKISGYYKRQQFLLDYIHGYVIDIIEKRRDIGTD